MSNTKKAKVASKNNPTERGAKRQMSFEGKDIQLIKVHFPGEKKSYMSACHKENKELILDNNGSPVRFNKLKLD